jgi:hypothetical protein
MSGLPPRAAGVASTTSAQGGTVTEGSPTLPDGGSAPDSNLEKGAQKNRPVMWAGPKSSDLGVRSTGPLPADTAGVVTGQPSAQRTGWPGASPASGGPAGSATPGLPPRIAKPEARVDAGEPSGHATDGHGERAAPESAPASISQVMVQARASRAPATPDESAEGVDFAALRLPQRPIAGPVLNELKARAVASVQGLSEAKCFDIVRAARTRIQRADAERKARKDTDATLQTLADYRKKCEQIDRELQQSTGDFGQRLRALLSRHAPKKQTFQAYQTALRAMTLERVTRLLKDQAKQQRDKRDPAMWQATVWLLAWALRDLELIDGIDRQGCLDATGQAPASSASKRSMLFRLDPQWRSRFLQINEHSPKYRMAGVLLQSCGVRPEELSLGVSVRYTSRGIRVFIVGAKVRSTAGQPWRTFLLDPAALPDWFVAEVRSRGRTMVTAEPDALRSHLGRQTEAVLNPLGRRRIDRPLSAYLFRHALVTDLREAGWSDEDIAPVIGESAAATVRLYGLRRRGGQEGPSTRRSAVIEGTVRVPRAVKPASTFPTEQLNVEVTKVKRLP